MLNSSLQIQARQILDIVYPIGIIVEFAENVNPNDIMHGQQWELYGEGKTTVCQNSGTFSTLGGLVGTETHTLTTEQMPAHTHTRGTMNITGNLNINDGLYSGDLIADGSFAIVENGSSTYTGSVKNPRTRPRVNFDASRSWIGATSSVGSGVAHNNIQPSIIVLRYRRIA